MQTPQAEVIAKKYRLGAHIYSGDLSWVYEASFVNTNRKASQILLILKTIPRSRLDKGKIQELKDRVHSEAKALASLDNPFIVKVIDYGEDGIMPYLVMRRRSMNLSEYLQANGKLSLTAAVPLLYNLATALDYAHTKGMVHRDIKPDNILLDLDATGQPLYAYITDFGIAQYQERPAHTKTNIVIGTMAYIPPERLEKLETTSLSDIYSFGLLAYEMLAGLPLFKPADTFEEQLHLNNLILKPSPEFFRGVKAKLDADVAAVILKAISRKPQDRYPTATEFAVSLGQLLPASQLAKVNQAIARNVQEAGRADALALMLDEKGGFKFSVLWLSVGLLCLFGMGFIWAQFMLGDEAKASASDLVEVSEEATVEATGIVSLTTSTATITEASPTASPSPTLTQTQTSTATITSIPSITPIPPTPKPEIDCLGAAWVYHRANRGDTLSHYAFSLVEHPAFANLDYTARQAYIRLINDDIDFNHLAIGQLVCLPAVPPPPYIATPSPILSAIVDANAIIPDNPGQSSGSGSSSGGGNGSGNGSGGNSSGGNGSGGQSTQVLPEPTAIPINVSISATCTNGNSGATSFRLTNNGSTSISISWKLMEGSTQITSGTLPLASGQSANAWSGNTKNKNYSLVVNETGASSGESCG